MSAAWRSTNLGCVCTVVRDQRVHRGLPYVGLEDIESNTGRFVGSLAASSVKSSTFQFSPCHILFGRLRPYLNKVMTPDFVGHCSTEILPLLPSPELFKGFLRHWLMRGETVEHINSTCTGARMPRANIGEILALEFSVPPLPEQQRIVTILDNAFESIAAAKANADKNLRNTRELFQRYLQSVFSDCGPGWTMRTLEEIATKFARGKSKHRPRNAPHLYGGKYPFVQTGDIRNAGHIITEYSQTYSEAGLTQSKLWPKGTVCITVAANIAETAILGFDACFPDSVIGVVANPKEADVSFIEYLLQSFKARIQAMGKGSAQANINVGTFENERFPFPLVAEQETVVGKLDDLAAETRRLESIYRQKLAALDALRQSLFHQAFTGAL